MCSVDIRAGGAGRSVLEVVMCAMIMARKGIGVDRCRYPYPSSGFVAICAVLGVVLFLPTPPSSLSSPLLPHCQRALTTPHRSRPSSPPHSYATRGDVRPHAHEPGKARAAARSGQEERGGEDEALALEGGGGLRERGAAWWERGLACWRRRVARGRSTSRSRSSRRGGRGRGRRAQVIPQTNQPKRRVRCDNGVRGRPQHGRGLRRVVTVGAAARAAVSVESAGSLEGGNVSVIIFDAPSWSVS
jgi:hypothetical protein